MKKQTYFVTLDLYVFAESEEAAKILAAKRLEKIADKNEMEPYTITDVGICDTGEASGVVL